MNKLTPQELNARIDRAYWGIQDLTPDTPMDSPEDCHRRLIKQLIRDCIEAVTPEVWPIPERRSYETDRQKGYNEAIDTIEANTKELLG